VLPAERAVRVALEGLFPFDREMPMDKRDQLEREIINNAPALLAEIERLAELYMGSATRHGETIEELQETRRELERLREEWIHPDNMKIAVDAMEYAEHRRDEAQADAARGRELVLEASEGAAHTMAYAYFEKLRVWAEGIDNE
jgi:hypothetical protein